jgi:hypothetical protein
MSKKVRVVAIYRVNGEQVERVAGDERAKPKRKSSRSMKMFERVHRTLLDANRTFAEESVARHDKSSRRKKDGWVMDMSKNQLAASRKAMKRIWKLRIL